MKHPSIDITIAGGDWPPLKKLITQAAVKTLKASGVLKKNKNTELSIVLADDAFIKKLNRRYRNINKPTNVLSFPQSGVHALGDVVLAYETVRREAKEQGKPFRHHAMHLIIHGILHLIGHDHKKRGAARKMESLEVRILKSFGVQNPYEP